MNTKLIDGAILLIASVFGLYLAGSNFAHAGEFVAGVGYGKMQDVPDNRYYQKPFDHEYNLYTPSLKLGYRFEPVEGWGL